MLGATARRWRDRFESRHFWFAVWISFLSGLALWFAWHHEVIAIVPAALGVAFATVRD